MKRLPITYEWYRQSKVRTEKDDEEEEEKEGNRKKEKKESL